MTSFCHWTKWSTPFFVRKLTLILNVERRQVRMSNDVVAGPDVLYYQEQVEGGAKIYCPCVQMRNC